MRNFGKIVNPVFGHTKRLSTNPPDSVLRYGGVKGPIYALCVYVYLGEWVAVTAGQTGRCCRYTKLRERSR